MYLHAEKLMEPSMLLSLNLTEAKDKEERLLKRQQNRERMEEKRKQRAAQLEEQST